MNGQTNLEQTLILF